MQYKRSLFVDLKMDHILGIFLQKSVKKQQITLLCFLDLYNHTTNKYPNIKQLSWEIKQSRRRRSVLPPSKITNRVLPESEKGDLDLLLYFQQTRFNKVWTPDIRGVKKQIFYSQADRKRPPPYSQPDRKISVFFYESPKGCNALRGQEMGSNQSGAVGGAILGPFQGSQTNLGASGRLQSQIQGSCSSS